MTFLDETFSSARSNPNHRYHQRAAQAVLKALLPETNADIKGRMRSSEELREFSGYAARPADFVDLIRTLDNELRLITPVDPEGSIDEDVPTLPAGGYHYQLTHDYLVHALRDWLTRKQRETRRGRAELRLAAITTYWRDHPERRHLPSLIEWLDIVCYTRPASWTEAQRQMMRSASRHYTLLGVIVGVVLAAVSTAGLEYRGRIRAEGLVSKLLVADTNRVSSIIREIEEDLGRTGSELDRIARDPRRSPKERLHAGLAVLPIDGSLDDYLYDRILKSEPDELIVIAERLRDRRAAFTGRLWALASHEETDRKARLRAASALAMLDPGSGRWKGLARDVSGLLVLGENALRLERWLDTLRPVRRSFQEPLAVIFRDRSRAEDERICATVILEQFAADNPRLLVDLIEDADLRQHAILLPVLKLHRTEVVNFLRSYVDEQPPVGATDNGKDELASQQANCAVTLLLLDQPEAVWPLLRHSPEPRLRSHLLDRMEPMGVDPLMLLARLRGEDETSARHSLILALSDYRGKGLPRSERAALERELIVLFRADPDPGIHSAVELLLRKWGGSERVERGRRVLVWSRLGESPRLVRESREAYDGRHRPQE